MYALLINRKLIFGFIIFKTVQTIIPKLEPATLFKLAKLSLLIEMILTVIFHYFGVLL